MAACKLHLAMLCATAVPLSILTDNTASAGVPAGTVPVEITLSEPLLKGGGDGFARVYAYAWPQVGGTKWTPLGYRDGETVLYDHPKCWGLYEPFQFAKIEVWFVKNGKVVENSRTSREFKGGHKWRHIYISKSGKKFTIDID